MTQQNGVKFIDLFSGCGGFSTGLEMAGHQCLLGVELDKDAVESFKQNHPQAKVYHDDIQQLSARKLKELIDVGQVDVVIGGPPCQGFSTAGRGRTEDVRNMLFREFVRIVKVCNPKIVIFENVTGLLAKKNQSILQQIFRTFQRQGYRMDARVLAAEEYGVPERRRRAIIIGTKNCSDPLFPDITHGPRGSQTLKTVAQAFRKLRSLDGKIYNHDRQTAQIKNPIDRQRLARIPDGRGIRYEQDELAYLPKSLRYRIDWDKLPERRFRQTKLQRLNSKLPAPTILTSRTSYYHPRENRYLTAREAAACQSFPNEFIFKGSLTAQFRQIGNAVPPLMAKAIGEKIYQMLKVKPLSARNKKIKTSEYYKGAFNYDHQVII